MSAKKRGRGRPVEIDRKTIDPACRRLGRRIAKRRRELGLSVAEAAEDVGMSTSQWYRLESGEHVRWLIQAGLVFARLDWLFGDLVD